MLIELNLSVITLFSVGFSFIVSIILLVVYLGFLHNVGKTIISVGSCGLLLIGLCGLQFYHYLFLAYQLQPIESMSYRLLLFIIPPMFYFFSCSLLMQNRNVFWVEIFHFAPIFLVVFLSVSVAIPLAFFIGMSYCFWVLSLVYRLRNHRKRFGVELFFFGFFAVFASIILVLGFLTTYINQAYFYYFYANGIGFAFALVIAALIIYPDMLSELSEVGLLSYVNSTLKNVDIPLKLEKLNSLMKDDKIFQDEYVNLSAVAQKLKLSSHQLSELINTHHEMSFSKFIRIQRIEAAKDLLLKDKRSSILAISMELGFKSQSNFYAAFKNVTGMSPGQYRKCE